MRDVRKIEEEIDFTVLRHEIDEQLKKMKPSLHVKKVNKNNNTVHKKNTDSSINKRIHLKSQGKVETISINSSIKKIVINLT